MRVRNVGALLRLFLIVALAMGTVLSNLAPVGTSSGTAPSASGVQAKDSKGQQQNKQGKSKAKKAGKDGQGKKGNGGGKGKNDKGKGKGNGNGKHKNKKTPAALDTQAIAARNKETVKAFDCADLDKVQVGDRTYCSHGEDPRMFGVSGDEDEPGAATAETAVASTRALCIDDGKSGPRVQLIYVHRNDRPNRLPELLTTFRRLAGEMDTIFDQSARKTGGSLHIRFVTNGNCQVDVKAFGAPENAIGGWGSLLGKLKEAGYDRIDRKYLLLVDIDSDLCGVGTFYHSDKPNTTAHNLTGYARVDRVCWDSGTMAHELSHTMGAVQYSAPHTSRGAHCIDEWDVMCYKDLPDKPEMKYLCKDGGGEFRLDCRDDDYFAAKPKSGSYLSRHWNMADSIYLVDGSGEECVDASLEPDDAYWYDFWGVEMREFEIGESEQHAFCEEAGDTDWVFFEGKRGKTYQVETTGLGPDVDTQLAAYRGFAEQHWAGMDQVGVNDDRAEGDSSSLLAFTAAHDVSFLIGVSEKNERAGFDKTYTLTIKEIPTNETGNLTLSRRSAKPKGGFTATMGELTPGAEVTFWWERAGNARELGQETANDEGEASGSYTVPKGVKKGSYQIEAIASDNSYATATLKVEIGGREGNKGKGKGKHKGKHKGKKGKKGKGGGGKH